MWPLWLFLSLAAIVAIVCTLAAGYARYMGKPEPVNFGRILVVSVLGAGLVTVLVMGVGVLLP